MNTSSPLRYPGGKSAMVGLLGDLRRMNGIGDRAMAEPFGGGAGASLGLLYLEETHSIYINDADRAIHDLWWALVNRQSAFQHLLSSTRVSIHEWRKQRETYRSSRRVSRLSRGFAAFYLNRCNRSGVIMNGGPIGGIRQKGKWKLGARYNKGELRKRCAKIGEYHERIHVSGKDGVDLIEMLDPRSTFLFIDPPYFEKGQTVYLNALDADYHERLAARLRDMSEAAWVLTYDDCSEVRHLYKDWAAIRPFSLRYAANKRRLGRELLITPKWMRLPTWQKSMAIAW